MYRIIILLALCLGGCAQLTPKTQVDWAKLNYGYNTANTQGSVSLQDKWMY